MWLLNNYIPIYNVEQYLPACLDSILSQSLREIEVICVNDASTDGSARIIEAYSQKDKRVISEGYEINRGQAYARNRGLERANGKYVYFVDADDMLKEGALEYLFNIMEEKGLEGLLFSAEVISEIEAEVNLESELRHRTYPGTFRGAELFSVLIENGDYSHNVWRQFWLNDYLKGNGLFFHEETSPHEDLLFTFKAILLAKRIKCINHVCYICRKREGSITTTKINLKKLMAFITCYGESLQFIQNNQHLVTNDLVYQLGSFFSLEKNYIVDAALYLCRHGFDISKLDVKNGFYRFILEAFVFNRYQHIPEFFSFELYKKIKNSKYVIIYGAGKVGHEVADQLMRYGITNFFMAVSNEKSNMNWCGDGIYLIDELTRFADESIVLVSVTAKYQRDMIDCLTKLQYHNYVCMC